MPTDYSKDPEFRRLLTKKNGIPYWIEKVIDDMVERDLIPDEKVALKTFEEYKFTLREIVWKSKKWGLRMDLGCSPDRIGASYVCALFYSPLEIERAIDAWQIKINQEKNRAQQSLLKGEMDAKIEEYEQEIAECRENIERKMEEYPPIFFIAKAEMMKWSNPAKLELAVAVPVILDIAKRTEDLSMYRLLLIEHAQA